MGKIDDPNLYPLTPITPGSTWIGTDPNGRTVQYSEEEMAAYIEDNKDFVLANKATRIGQTIIGNLAGIPENSYPLLNEGGTFIAELLALPIVDQDSVRFIHKIR